MRDHPEMAPELARHSSRDSNSPTQMRCAWNELAEPTPLRADDEKQTGERERDAENNRPRAAKTEHWDLRGDEPDTGEEDEQESELYTSAGARLLQDRAAGRRTREELLAGRVG